MIGAEREAAFQRELERSVPYFDAVRDGGDLPWFCEGHPRRAEAVERLGLSEDIAEIDLRRAVFFGRYSRPAPPAGLSTDPRQRDWQSQLAPREPAPLDSRPESYTEERATA